jgi:hypothetical protein
MRALRIPLVSDRPDDPSTPPAWIIDGERRRTTNDRLEAPRLEVPRDDTMPDGPAREAPPREPLPGSTVIVIPL